MQCRHWPGRRGSLEEMLMHRTFKAKSVSGKREVGQVDASTRLSR